MRMLRRLHAQPSASILFSLALPPTLAPQHLSLLLLLVLAWIGGCEVGEISGGLGLGGSLAGDPRSDANWRLGSAAWLGERVGAHGGLSGWGPREIALRNCDLGRERLGAEGLRDLRLRGGGDNQPQPGHPQLLNPQTPLNPQYQLGTQYPQNPQNPQTVQAPQYPSAPQYPQYLQGRGYASQTFQNPDPRPPAAPGLGRPPTVDPKGDTGPSCRSTTNMSLSSILDLFSHGTSSGDSLALH